jgi:hypothetical protein
VSATGDPDSASTGNIRQAMFLDRDAFRITAISSFYTLITMLRRASNQSISSHNNTKLTANKSDAFSGSSQDANHDL